MPEAVRLAFERRIVMLPLSSILPLKQVPATIKRSVKYRRIAKSIMEVGVIEPIVVASQPDGAQSLLLDGHLRYSVLVETARRCV